MLAVGLRAGATNATGIRPPAHVAPAAALDFVKRTAPSGPAFNQYNFGGALILAGIPTFIDGRAELFGSDFIKRYFDAVTLRGDQSLEAFLENHAIGWALLGSDQPATRQLLRSRAWCLAYDDSDATIFVRCPNAQAPPAMSRPGGVELRGDY